MTKAMTKTGNKPLPATKAASATQAAPEVALGVAPQVAKDRQRRLQEQALLLKSQMSTTAASVVAYQGTSGDYGDMSQQSEQEWLFLNQNRANAKELSLIEGALRRIEDGSYGICSHCAQPISPRRLQALPWAEYCVDCQDGNGDGHADNNGNGNGKSAAA
jgi:DnaK suppressor protein